MYSMGKMYHILASQVKLKQYQYNATCFTQTAALTGQCGARSDWLYAIS